MTMSVLFQQSISSDGITLYAVPLSIIIIVLYVFASFAIHEYKRTNGTAPCCHESSVATLLGIVFGGVLKILTGHSVTFDKNLFFYLILPPVIFSAGYSLRRRNFFRYFHMIFIFGVLGTILQFVMVTAAIKFLGYIFAKEFSWSGAMLLSSVLSASDEVSAMSLVRMTDFPRMGALIFGEDWNEHQQSKPSEESFTIFTAISLMFTVLSQLILSTLIGSSIALVHAKILKKFVTLREHPVHQTSLLLLFGYFAYALAECVDVSGIVSVFVAGITLAHYSWHSLSKTAQLSTKVCLLSMSDIAEAFAFAYVGLSLWSSSFLGNAFVFGIATVLALVISRLITIFGLSKLISLVLGKEVLPMSEQLGFAVAGMVRGSLCWATVLQIDHDKGLYVTTVMVVIMITTFGGGIVLPLLMPLLLENKNESSVNVLSPLYMSVARRRPSSPSKIANLSKSDQIELENSPVRIELENSSISPTSYRENNVEDNFPPSLYLLWVKFDETIMKVHFGGSTTLSRNYLLEETKSMSIQAILTDTNGSVKDIVSQSKDHRVEVGERGPNPYRKVVFDEDSNNLNEDEYIGITERLEDDLQKSRLITPMTYDGKGYGATGTTLTYDDDGEEKN